MQAAPDEHWIHFLPGIYNVPAYGEKFELLERPGAIFPCYYI